MTIPLGKKPKLHSGKLGAAITVRVTPRASQNEITGLMEDGTIKIRLTAPPVEGKANEALVRFLSGVLGVPPSRIEILGGENSHNKLVAVLDMDSDTLQQKILSQVKK